MRVIIEKRGDHDNTMVEISGIQNMWQENGTLVLMLKKDKTFEKVEEILKEFLKFGYLDDNEPEEGAVPWEIRLSPGTASTSDFFVEIRLSQNCFELNSTEAEGAD